MPLPKNGPYTINDIYSLPDGERAELIGGEIYMMSPPGTMHQSLVLDLAATIRDYIKRHGGDCRPYVAPFAVFLNKDNDAYVEPDISVICDPEKVTESGCVGAPDWVIEVVSPSSRKRDYSTKNSLYSESGVREYWIVDPEKMRTTIYRYEEDAAPAIFLFNQSIPVGVIDGLIINISDL